MAQVQLYLAKSQYGYSSLGNINPSEEVVRYIKDFSPALKIIDYDASKLEVFYLVKYIEEGLLLTLLRPIEGAPGNHYAATLFFPLGLKISKDQLLNLAGSVREALLTGTDPGSEVIAELRQMLAPDYGIDESRPHFLTSQGTSLAVIFIGEPAPTLGDFFDVRFYQPEYANFNGILLVDRHSGAKVREGIDVLSGELRTMYTVYPPKGTLGGFSPYVFREPFTRPIMAGRNTVIDIVWRRKGFETISTQVKVEHNDMTVPVCDTSVSRKLLTNNSFYVTEQSSRKLIKDFSVKVNGTDINGPTPFTFSELSHADVVVTAIGYVNYSGKMDLAGSSQALVQMRKLHKSYRFDMPLLTPEPLEPLRIYIKTLKPLTNCPIEGYEVAGGNIVEGGASNSLYYVGKQSRSRLFVAIGALVGALLLGFLIGWLVFSGSNDDIEPAPAPSAEAVVTETTPQEVTVDEAAIEEVTPPAEEKQEETAPAVEEQAAPTPAPAPETIDYKDAVTYLEGNKNWARSEMEAIPALRGLFDDLNSYNFEKIKTYWEPLLKDSKRFGTLVEAVKGSASKRDPRKAPHAPTYSTADESTINWRSYTFWVDP